METASSEEKISERKRKRFAAKQARIVRKAYKIKPEQVGIPEPKLGGTFVYCPHATVELVKVPRKKPKEVIVHCKFKTHNLRKYRRHFINRHTAKPEKTEATLTSIDGKIEDTRAARKRTPRYAKGDSRRKND